MTRNLWSYAFKLNPKEGNTTLRLRGVAVVVRSLVIYAFLKAMDEQTEQIEFISTEIVSRNSISHIASAVVESAPSSNSLDSLI